MRHHCKGTPRLTLPSIGRPTGIVCAGAGRSLLLNRLPPNRKLLFVSKMGVFKLLRGCVTRQIVGRFPIDPILLR
jgi:hypothetical protein